jgi:hypothetical protein
MDINNIPYKKIKIKDIRGISCKKPSTTLKPSISYFLGLRENTNTLAKTKKRIKFSENNNT